MEPISFAIHFRGEYVEQGQKFKASLWEGSRSAFAEEAKP